MDDDALRRGKPTCHVKFDEATAILAGDALQSMAFEILAGADLSEYADKQKAALILALSRAAGANGMVGGQSLDLAATNQEISLEHLTQLHQLKTGAILKSCVDLPCIISEKLSADEHSIFLRFAEHIGLAFQIQDDILDVVSSTETLGKPQGSDEDANKSTFVSLLGLDGAKEALNKHHQQAIDALDTLESLSYDTEKLKVFSDFMITRKY
jgi:farnesyl diphosphate synthase